MNPAKLEIRPITPLDLPVMLELWKELVSSERATFQAPASPYPQVDLSGPDTAVAWASVFLRQLALPGAFGLLATYAGVPVAYVLGCSGVRPLGKPKVYALVLEMYTKPTYRTWRHLARSMKQAIEDWALAVGATHLEVTACGSAKQVDRWVRKGFEPYLVYLRREIKPRKKEK